MRYDRDGFPIPSQFDTAVDAARDEIFPGRSAGRSAVGRTTAAGRPGGSKKRAALLAAIALLLLAIALPAVMPAIRQAVVQWSLEQAAGCEAHGDIRGAIAGLGRAIRWHGDDVDLLCARAMLRLEHRDATGAVDDSTRAAEIAPTAVRPWRVRALANVVLERPDDALSDAEMVMSLSSRDDPEALNHRAYIRALVGRDLPAALEDIDRALAGGTESAPEMVDTRGYLLHLVGRHREAVDQLNEAINGLQQARRRLSLLSGRIDPVDLACRVRAMDHALAVMLHHRALACRAVGLEEQARQDFELAERKGFDPSRGIF
jgi:tetratricopeptide (TPR) repeat protein